MGKAILGILMAITGLLGLGATICGVVFLPSQGIGLIGIIPGALLLWAAWAMWKSFKVADKSSAPATPTEVPKDPA
jgi:threonine/homoserine/homoserine lactone efflux protein